MGKHKPPTLDEMPTLPDWMYEAMDKATKKHMKKLGREPRAEYQKRHSATKGTNDNPDPESTKPEAD